MHTVPGILYWHEEKGSIKENRRPAQGDVPMRAIKLKAAVDKHSVLSVALPSDIPSGMVDVIVLVEQNDASPAAANKNSLDELLAFHRDHRLDGITLKELAEEGRR